MKKRARRTPYVSLLPRRSDSAYLMWNVGRALMHDPSSVDIEVGYFSPTSDQRFIVVRRVGPPQLQGGTFVHLPEGLEEQHFFARIVGNTFPKVEKKVEKVEQRRQVSDCHDLDPVYATSKPVLMVRQRSLSAPVRFVTTSISPEPLVGVTLTCDELDGMGLPQKQLVRRLARHPLPSSATR